MKEQTNMQGNYNFTVFSKENPPNTANFIKKFLLFSKTIIKNVFISTIQVLIYFNVSKQY